MTQPRLTATPRNAWNAPTKVRAGLYRVGHFLIRKVEIEAIGSTPRQTVWNLEDDAEFVDCFSTKAAALAKAKTMQ